jgi:hypothetical protein
MGTPVWAQTGVTEVVRIFSVYPDHVTVRDQRGGSLDIYYSAGTPVVTPRVGQKWYVYNIAKGIWRLDQPYDATRKNILSYSMIVDAETCIGKEEPVAEKIASLGVDEVWLTVARMGDIFWDSAYASQYGLNMVKDSVSAMMTRLDVVGIKVVLCIDWGLWNGASIKHKEYQQEAWVSGSLPNHSTTFLPLASPFKAREALGNLAEELMTLFPSAIGVSLLNVHIGGRLADYCGLGVNAFYKKYKKMPLIMDSFTDTEEEWSWPDFLRASLEECCSYVKLRIGSKKFAVSVHPSVWRDIDDLEGSLDNGVRETFSGGSRANEFTFPLVPAGEGDERVVSLDFQAAFLKRMASPAAPLVTLSVTDYDLFEYALPLVSAQGIGRVLLDSFDDLSALGLSVRSELVKVMESNQMLPVVVRPHIGVLCSFKNLDLGNITSSAVEYVAMLASLESGYPLSVLFDSDLITGGSLGIRTVLLAGLENMSDGEVDGLLSLLDRQDFNVVASGLVGYTVARGDGATRIPPLWGHYGAQYISHENVSAMLAILPECPVSPGVGYDAETRMSQTVVKVGSVMTGGVLLVSGRSFISGVDLHSSAMTSPLLADLLTYSASR